MRNLNHLPNEILLDIVTRLPIESILDCKSVCRQWRNLVSHNPSFSPLHLSRLNDIDSGKKCFLVLYDKQVLHYFDYDVNDDETPIRSIRRINFTPPLTCLYKVVGSINGLVFFYGYKDEIGCVCNPVTKESVMIPKISRDCHNHYNTRAIGFGYLPLTDEYKVVGLYDTRDFGCLEVAVYTLGSANKWRKAERLCAAVALYVYGKFAYGALYWRDVNTGSVFAFDLTEEKFSEHLRPPTLLQNGAWVNHTLGVLDGVLYYAIRDKRQVDKCFEIWLLRKKNDIAHMKQQGEHELLGWSKELSIREDKLLAFTKSRIVLCYNLWFLGIYDTIASTSRKLIDFPAFSKILPHKNTLVSMKELREEDKQIVESAELRRQKAVIC
ncbi:F-box protein At3g07870-like [Papaver somniferum]|uniref:F-box protein At3g07870-like n=1 Tax=Papaver somniferum TaxID=3469 RepID=UPI000E6FA143|nr:F-box protein At3g07870-like [Papaver somniferum]